MECLIRELHSNNSGIAQYKTCETSKLNLVLLRIQKSIVTCNHVLFRLARVK